MPRSSNLKLDLFLNLLYPWSTTEDHQLFKTVTWTFFPNGEDKLKWANFSAQNYDKLVKLIETRSGRQNANLYVALGTLRMADYTKTTTDGYPKAIRQHSNVVSNNSVYLDVDVKDGAYASPADAKVAIKGFIQAVGLPKPTMVMKSGTGGYHVYWCGPVAIPVETWKTYARTLAEAAKAYGLFIDTSVTVNPVGVLRVPGSYNWKTVPPTQVVFDEPFCSWKRYDIAQLHTQVLAYAQANAKAATMSTAMPMGTRGTKVAQNFQANVGSSAPTPDIDAVATGCPLVKSTLASGGAGQREPLWNLMMLLSAFTADPVDAAHKLSSGHAQYIPAETDKKLTDKINARANNPSLGWPSCSGFDAERDPTMPSICQACPNFTQGKSPLNFAAMPQAQPAPPGGTDPLMPLGYWRDTDNHIWTSVADGPSTRQVEVIPYPVVDAGIDQDTGALVFRAAIGGVEEWCSVNVSTSVTDNGAAGSLASTGIMIANGAFKQARNLLMSWMAHLQNTKATIKSTSLGWTSDRSGFTFDKIIYVPGGTQIAYRSFEDSNYCAKGKLQPWKDAMALIYGNAPLECVVASAFAAPLVELFGSESVVMSIHSAASGCGKTTAMKLAQGVWGDPVKAMSTLNDTNNAFMHKISNMRSLPCYWDELRTHKDMERVADLIFMVTQGKGKARMTRDIKLAETNGFKTMFVVASNYGLNEAIYSNTSGTEAGGLRVFELEAAPIAGSRFDMVASQQMMLEIHNSNFGNAGVAYIRYLVDNKANVVKAIKMVARDMHTRHKFDTKERFWASTMATILVGARLANLCGITRFNLASMEKCMVDALAATRANMRNQAYRTISRPDAALGILSEMIAFAREKNLVVTATIPMIGTKGKPLPQLVISPSEPRQLANVWIRVGDTDGRIRVRCADFDEYMRKRELSPQQIRKQLERDYLVVQARLELCGGVHPLDFMGKVAGGRVECYDFTPRVSPSPETTPGSSSPTTPSS